MNRTYVCTLCFELAFEPNFYTGEGQAYNIGFNLLDQALERLETIIESIGYK